MNVVGIIAEYNPFHEGHAYQIQKAKEHCCLLYTSTKLNKWTDFQILISIHHHIQISKIVFFFHGTIRRNKFLINCHVLTEKSMTCLLYTSRCV